MSSVSAALITPPQRAHSPRTRWIIAAVFGVLATVISAVGSWIPSLWGDEAASLLSAERPIPSLLRMVTHVDAVHGLYYLILHFWVDIAGTSAFALRLPSAFAIGVAVSALTLLAGRGSNTKLAIIAGVIGCILPRLTYEGEEARSYPFSAANATLMTLLLVWLVAGSGRTLPVHLRRWCWIAYGVGMALSSYLFLYFVSLLLAHLVLLAFSRVSRSTWRAWAICAGSIILSLTPLLLLAYFERSQISYLANSSVSPVTLLYSIWFSTPAVAVIAWLLIAASLLQGVLRWRSHRLASVGAVAIRASHQPLSTTLIGASWLFVPTGALLVVNVVFPLYTERYSSFAAPAAALLIAEGIVTLGAWLRRAIRLPALAGTTAGALVFVAICVPVYLSQRGPYSKNDSDWAEVSAAMGRVAHPGDAVVFDEGARPSQKPRLAMRTYPAGFAHVRDITLKTPYYDNDGWADRAYSVPGAAAHGRFTGVTRVWLIELDTDGHQHTYGITDLLNLGFHESGARVHTHREMLIEFVR